MSTRYLKVAPPSSVKPILKFAPGLFSQPSHLTSHSFKRQREGEGGPAAFLPLFGGAFN